MYAIRSYYEIVPTEVDNYYRKQQVQGTVHDEAAAVFGGVAGNAKPSVHIAHGVFLSGCAMHRCFSKVIFLLLRAMLNKARKVKS